MSQFPITTPPKTANLTQGSRSGSTGYLGSAIEKSNQKGKESTNWFTTVWNSLQKEKQSGMGNQVSDDKNAETQKVNSEKTSGGKTPNPAFPGASLTGAPQDDDSGKKTVTGRAFISGKVAFSDSEAAKKSESAGSSGKGLGQSAADVHKNNPGYEFGLSDPKDEKVRPEGGMVPVVQGENFDGKTAGQENSEAGSDKITEKGQPVDSALKNSEMQIAEKNAGNQASQTDTEKADATGEKPLRNVADKGEESGNIEKLSIKAGASQGSDTGNKAAITGSKTSGDNNSEGKESGGRYFIGSASGNIPNGHHTAGNMASGIIPTGENAQTYLSGSMGGGSAESGGLQINGHGFLQENPDDLVIRTIPADETSQKGEEQQKTANFSNQLPGTSTRFSEGVHTSLQYASLAREFAQRMERVLTNDASISRDPVTLQSEIDPELDPELPETTKLPDQQIGNVIRNGDVHGKADSSHSLRYQEHIRSFSERHESVILPREPVIISGNDHGSTISQSISNVIPAVGGYSGESILFDEKELTWQKYSVTGSDLENPNDDDQKEATLSLMRLSHMPAVNADVRRDLLPGLTRFVQFTQETEKARPGSWQNHHITIDDGKNLRISIREVEGVLHLKLGSSSSELARLLQQHSQDIREHLEKECNIEIDLQLDGDGKGEFEQMAGDSSGRNGAHHGEGTLHDPAEALHIRKVAPQTIRDFGYNQMEWTA